MRKLRPHHVLEATIVVVIVVGALLAASSGWRLSSVRAENERLVKRVGRLKIDDPTRVHVVAMPSDDPMTFVWRVHFPANYNATYSTYYSSGNTASSFSTSVAPYEGVVRARMRAFPNDEWKFYSAIGGSSSLGDVSGDDRLMKIVKGHWNRLRAEQLGYDEMVSFAPDEGFVLLRIVLPPDLIDEAERQGGQELRHKAEKGLVRFIVGTVHDP